MSTFIVLLMKGSSQIIQPGIFKISEKHVYIPMNVYWDEGRNMHKDF